MIIINEIQGSAGWLAARQGKRTGSEAPVAMGASKKLKRNELIHMKKTLTEKEVSDWVQKNLFDKGHAAEASARPIAEGIAGEELYPVTATDDDGYLLASYDGLTMLEDVSWEHKIWNEAKAADVRSGIVPEEDRWQVVQGLVVSGAEKCLYMVSDGTKEKCVWCWYELQPGDADSLARGWAQFDEDLAAYTPAGAVVEAVGKAPDTLPALRIEVTGMVTASNLAEFKAAALGVIGAVNDQLETDQDFADAEKAVKWCKETEERLAAAKQHALSQTATIDELFRTIDDISEEARQKRLSLDKLIKARKTVIRDEIVMTAAKALHDYVEQLNGSLGGKVRMPAIAADFAGVIKGKKTIDSLRNAADTELARAKIEANKTADHMRANLDALRTQAKGFEFLFSDAPQLAMKQADDLKAVITARISEHKEAEQARLDAERERIRKEEAARLEAEQKERDRKAEEKRIADEMAQRAAVRGGQTGGVHTSTELQQPDAAVLERPSVIEQAVIAEPRYESRHIAGAPAQSTSVAVVNKLELLKAIINGEVPDHVITIDHAALLELCNELKRPVPGTTLAKAA